MFFEIHPYAVRTLALDCRAAALTLIPFFSIRKKAAPSQHPYNACMRPFYHPFEAFQRMNPFSLWLLSQMTSNQDRYQNLSYFQSDTFRCLFPI